MNCVSCGAIITSDQKRCPYCGAKNPEYERKNAIFSWLDIQYEDAKDRTKNRIVNFFLASVVVLFVSIVSAMLLGYGIVKTAEGIRIIQTGNSYVSAMEEYYSQGEYEKLNSFMEQNDLFGKEKYYKYSQAAHIIQGMNDFRAAAYPFVEYVNGERSDTKYTCGADSLVFRAHTVADWRFLEGEKVYLEQVLLCEENEQLYQDCMTEMKYVFLYYFGMTEEEFNDCFYGDGFYSGDYARIIEERTGYFDEK